MKTFRVKNQVPPGGWFYTVPETGTFIRSLDSLRDLCYRVQAHLGSNNLPVPDRAALEATIVDRMCDELPAGFCSEPGSGVKRLDLFSVSAATELLFRRVKEPDFFVDRREAERRAAICSGCPMNAKHMCTTCNGLRDAFGKMLRGRRGTSLDSKLGVCRACGCGLPAKVHVSRKYLDKTGVVDEKLLPSNCWLKEEIT